MAGARTDMTAPAGVATGVGTYPTWAPVLGLAGYLAAVAAQVVAADDHNQDTGDWAIAIGIAAVVTAAAVAVARWAVGRGDRSIGRTAAAFGGLAALGIVVFWAGVPAVLGAGAVGLALAGRRASGSFSGPGMVGLVLGGAALVVGLVGLAGGW